MLVLTEHGLLVAVGTGLLWGLALLSLLGWAHYEITRDERSFRMAAVAAVLVGCAVAVHHLGVCG